LIDEIFAELVAEALTQCTARDIDVDLRRVRALARQRAVDLVEQEIIPATRKIVHEISLAGVKGDATADELVDRIINSHAFGAARALMLARVCLDGDGKGSTAPVVNKRLTARRRPAVWIY
jgi:hypothetical protein